VLVQGALARRGYYDGQIDGVAGPGTRSAIREFQHDNGLPVTGRIDSQLVQSLTNQKD
jgi:peptidoglycan hydrolase-like protein with peptidoglycan-binding domain